MEHQEKTEEKAVAATAQPEAGKYPIFLKMENFVCKIFNKDFYKQYMCVIYEPLKGAALWESYSCARYSPDEIEKMLQSEWWKPATAEDYEDAKKKYLQWHTTSSEPKEKG